MSPPYAPQIASLLAQAVRLLQAGQPAYAVVPLREASRWLPDDPDIQHDLGLACLECGQIVDAIAALRACIAARPSYGDAHLRLGMALEAAGLPQEALDAYGWAERLLPALTDPAVRAGCLLDGLGLAQAAASAFRRAAGAAPGTLPGRLAMARALLSEQRDGEAEKVLRRILGEDRGNALALNLLGNLLADAGRFADARKYLLRALERAPALAGDYYDVARCERIGPQDVVLVERMRAALAQPTLTPVDRARVHLALGKAAQDLGDFQEAMRQFDAAEVARDGFVRFDPAKFEARVDELITRFGAEQMALAPWVGRDDPLPVLIVGLPRSGTTLVEQILSSHPDVGAGGELPFWNERGGLWERATTPESELSVIMEAAIEYPKLLRGIAPSATRVTDKMPLNFQWAGLIHLALPRATFIHCRRDPLDTALSIHQTHFNPRLQFPTGGEALVRYIRAYERLCAHWREVLPSERFIEIDYEDLVRDPQPQVRRMLDACGLSWHASCLNPQSNGRPIRTPSKWQARQPINAGSVGRWRQYEPWLGALARLRAR